MEIFFNDLSDYNPPESGTLCLVECPEYCPSGCFVAIYSGGEWTTDAGDDITEYVLGYLTLEL